MGVVTPRCHLLLNLSTASVAKGCNVTAVDPNPAMASYAEEAASRHALNSFSVVEGVAEQLPFEDNSFDRVVCTLASHSCLTVPYLARCALPLHVLTPVAPPGPLLRR